jgi:hypothetical protein
MRADMQKYQDGYNAEGRVLDADLVAAVVGWPSSVRRCFDGRRRAGGQPTPYSLSTSAVCSPWRGAKRGARGAPSGVRTC